MLGFLMRYCLHYIYDNHDLTIELIFFNVIQFECAHLNYILR